MLLCAVYVMPFNLSLIITSALIFYLIIFFSAYYSLSSLSIVCYLFLMGTL